MVSLYMLQPRNLMFTSAPTLPNRFELIAELAPAAGFVGIAEPSLTAHANGHSNPSCDVYSGRIGFVSDPPLPPVAVSLLTQPHHISLIGNQIVVSGQLSDLREVSEIIATIEHALVPLLNLEVHDTAAVVAIHGTIGDEPVQWGFHTTAGLTINSVEIKSYTRQLVITLRQITKLHDEYRLYGALHYFSTACRLSRVGNSLWEFAPEIILNFAKTCECLFEGECSKKGSGTQDDCRAGLQRLGFSNDEIEGSFIPMLLLRNQFGSGHVSLALYDPALMVPIYKYLEFAEDKFRALLKRVVSKVSDEGYKLWPTSRTPDKRKVRTLKELAQSISRILPTLPWEEG